MMNTRNISRRDFLRLSGVTAAGIALASCAPGLASPAAVPTDTPITTPDQALQRLVEGNERYVANKMNRPNQSQDRRAELAKGQKPWAAVWGCIDSRVPPEFVFDRGLGDLFVVRTAGQVIDNAALGSLEFTVEEGVKLILVLGHENCGAVKAAIETIEKNGHADGQIDALVKAIKPAIEKAKSQSGDKVDNVVRANVMLEMEQLKTSEIVSHALKEGAIKLVGARYDLDTGKVEIIA